MKKTNFILTAAFAAIFASAISAFGQETLIPGPVQDEQKLMVTIRLQISDGGKILTEKQDGFVLFPQTVITAISPLIILGARPTIITKEREIPVALYFVDAKLGLAELMLVSPITVDDATTAKLFSTENESENLFLLTSKGILSIDALTQKEDAWQYKGDIIVDSRGSLSAIVLNVKKHDSGELVPRVISRRSVVRFIKYYQKESTMPEVHRDTPQDNRGISLDTI